MARIVAWAVVTPDGPGGLGGLPDSGGPDRGQGGGDAGNPSHQRAPPSLTLRWLWQPASYRWYTITTIMFGPGATLVLVM
jgi:hypothetical protein